MSLDSKPEATKLKRWPFVIAIGVAALALGYGIFWLASGPRLSEPRGSGFLCDQRFTVVVDGAEVRIPYCANIDLSDQRTMEDITHVVVAIHGMKRKARHSYKSAARAARGAGAHDNTIIIAPQFLKRDDISSHSLDATHASWKKWLTGEPSTKCSQCPPQVAAYAVLDSMLESLLSRFELPDLHMITIVGHSAGGQFVNRFSATSGFTTDAELRYVVLNPSSYLYFSTKRPVLPDIDRFEVPAKESVEACPNYNRYRYGLDRLKPYMKALGAAGMRARYVDRLVYYLVGSEDDDPSHESLSKRCPAMLQGAHRHERAFAYLNHLRDEFGDQTDHQRFAVVAGVGHQSRRMFSSVCGIAAVFGVWKDDCHFVSPGGDPR